MKCVALSLRHLLKPDVRESLYDACNEWIRAIGNHRQFMGGDRPNLADLVSKQRKKQVDCQIC